ncbi:MAG: hypothetical protein E6H91_13005 [Chloroflexi bacterium]|nr:MAG: hypothetical protein E6H91_13005 [Chloroflexota bacterium]
MHTAITTPAAFLTYTTLYVPLIVSAIALALRGTARVGWRRWAFTGLLGIATAIIWDHPLTFGGAVLAAPLMVAGAAVAEPIWRVVERPTRGRVLTLVTLAGICAPALTGVLDLALRSRTP